jgi:hypothetical protein
VDTREIGDNMRRIVRSCLHSAVKHSLEPGVSAATLYALCEEFCEMSDFLSIMHELTEKKLVLRIRQIDGTTIYGRA